MKTYIKPLANSFDGSITIPGSKSITNRALLLAALAGGESILHGVLNSDDTLAFANALRVLGVNLHWDEAKEQCKIRGCDGKFPQKRARVWCQDAGTAARFLLSALSSASGQFEIDGSARLRERPLRDLIAVLTQQGTQFFPAESEQLPLRIIGCDGLLGGEITISGKLSSQFISGLLMIAPFAKKNVIMKVKELISRPYVAMTCAMMRQFGVNVEEQGSQFLIATPQQYHAKEYVIEPDLSTASYFFAAAALTQSVITIPHISRSKCLQGDIQFVNVLEKMGCQVSETDFGLRLEGVKNLRGIEIDMGDFSDTFMTLAVIAPFAQSAVTITNIAHTRLQECDRITAVENNLKLLGVRVESGHDFIRIYPSSIQANTVLSYRDHRIAMAFALIGLKIPGIAIEEAECVAKTCPNYFAMLERLHLMQEKIPHGVSIN
ncbi:MAG: 3-phosphoshikimate 1-carboxyvinyltransferase [Legionellales bacterium]|nr:3-phosphoshikimate 1-carboxyvinyltransferase [Legionellales bacterium]